MLWAAPKFAIDTVAQANRVLAARERTESVPDSVIVRLRDFDSQLKSAINRPVDSLTLQRVSQAVGVGLVHERAMSGNAHALKLDRPMTHREYDALLARLEANPEVDMVSGNYRAGTNASVIPNDKYFTKQWSLYGPQDGYYGIDAIRAWTISTGSPTTIVSVVDTGIRPLPPRRSARRPSGTHPVYRSYNGRAQFNDTNHRFTTSLETYQQMKTAGWINEGPVFCAS